MLKPIIFTMILAAVCGGSVSAQTVAKKLGEMPDADKLPKAEFVFEERVTLSPAVVQGKTALGGRQYIPITGGTVAGPKLKGRVIPGGWDYQLQMPGGCGTLSADYFLEAEDGTIIHVLNEAFNCGVGSNGERSYTRPRFEAPEGAYGWLTRGVFVSTIELDNAGAPAADGKPAPLAAIRIKFYQIK